MAVVVVVAAVLLGLTSGLVGSHLDGPRGTRLLRLAALVQYLAVVGVLVWGLHASAVVIGALVLSSGAVSVLANGAVWRDSPLLVGERYWSRVWFVLWNPRIRETARAVSAPEVPTTR